ncbi:MAG: NupC/NupG family nucleoside CNT transporter [Proteobacteria bacterium]|nr:NupC/NupG family nucleoside CNT transporter [Pseudomonadota bacterium]
MSQLQGLIGIIVLLSLAALLSENRRRFPWRLALSGIALQFVIGVLALKTPIVVQVVDLIARLVNGVILRADVGIAFVFGETLVSNQSPIGFVFAVRVLPVIIFFASLMAVLYHLGVMQRIIAALAWLLRKTLGVTGAEAMVMASNVFVGQTEAPLCVRPYLDRLTRAQFMTLMVGGFATIAGSVLAAYVGILGGLGPEFEEGRVLFIKHLLTASVMSAPAAFVMARIIVPETETPMDEAVHADDDERRASNLLDAAAGGATEGLHLCLNVAAMLIAFVSLVALINWPLGALSEVDSVRALLDSLGVERLSLQSIFGLALTPLAWTMGIAWSDCGVFATLLGEKLVVTEFIAYSSLGDALNAPGGPTISMRSGQIAAYALCGFANFASIGIQIGGLTVLAPNRRKLIVSLAVKAMLGGALASWMTASVAGLLI